MHEIKDLRVWLFLCFIMIFLQYFKTALKLVDINPRKENFFYWIDIFLNSNLFFLSKENKNQLFKIYILFYQWLMWWRFSNLIQYSSNNMKSNLLNICKIKQKLSGVSLSLVTYLSNTKKMFAFLAKNSMKSNDFSCPHQTLIWSIY
jgi:hypothetical protein